MTVEQIEEMNKKFQDRALSLSELIPQREVLEFSSLLKRKSGAIHTSFQKMIHAQEETRFWECLESTEEIMDDLVYELDRLHDLNCLMKIKTLEDFIKFGYDLLSVYSMASDQLVKHKANIHKVI